MDAKTAALFEQRKERVSKTLQNEKADRIPLVAWRSDYLVPYYGYQMSEIDNYDKMLEIYKRANEEFDWDVCDLTDPFGLTYPLKGEALRGSMYHMNDDRNAVQIDPSVVEIMGQDEYDAFIKDPLHMLGDVILPRRYKLLSEDVLEEEKFAGLDRIAEINAKSFAFRKQVVEETGLLGSSHVFWSVPIDYIFDMLRNFTGIVKDIRRCPEKVCEASDIMVEYYCKDIRKQPRIPYSMATSALHLAPFLKPADFEKVYWPYFRKLVETSFECGHQSKLLFEKSWKHVFDFLDELPKNCICGYFEKEDGFGNVVKRFGDKMIIVGGIESDLLARGTVEQVEAQVKDTIDKYCGDGGVMMATDLPIIYKVDAKPENYKAAMETVRKYGNY